MRILITGAKGQLGSELCSLLAKGTSVFGSVSPLYYEAEVLATDSGALDISNADAVSSCIASFMPNLVINCAAFNDVDACEGNPKYAYGANIRGPRLLAEESKKQGAVFVHLSSDYVFSGDASAPLSEQEAVGPINAYGKSKLQGEEEVRAVNKKSHIIRTAWLYGNNEENFVRKILKQTQKRDELRVVDDQFGSPTNAQDLAYEVLRIAQTGDYGIWHCANTGVCSRFEFASAIVEIAGIDCGVKPQKTAEYAAAASRPAFSALENVRLRAITGDTMRSWQDALTDYLENM